MRFWRDASISAGFALFRATGLHRLLAPVTRGRGAILMFHHVCATQSQPFAPNSLLEITPEFLQAVIELVRARGFEIVSMDEALRRLARQPTNGEKPFVVLSFDDGYRDNLDNALPVLKRLEAPFILYVTTGFADRTAHLWWRELEAAVRALDDVSIQINGQTLTFPARTSAQKSAAFAKAYWQLRAMPEPEMLDQIAELCENAGVDGRALVEAACMDWPAIEAISREPLCTIGVHTLTHAMLAKQDALAASREMSESRRVIEAHTGKPARHLSYPVGDVTSAGEREFAMARELGFASAVTTRPGMILANHANRLTALPRLSINGNWQQVGMVDVLLSGAPFALINKGRPA